jgi:hypothetical protein
MFVHFVPGGIGDNLGNDVLILEHTTEPSKKVLDPAQQSSIRLRDIRKTS